MFGALRKIGGAVSKLSRSPVGRLAGLVPGLGTVVNAVGIAGGVAGAVSALSNRSGGSGSGLPMLPSGRGGLPMLPGTAGAPSIVGDRSIFRNDPNIAEALKQWAISKGNLRVSYRSPMKGYVVVRDSNGDPFALPKDLARKYAGWKAGKKPPISVGDWQAVKRADKTVKKVRKVMTTMIRVDKAIAGGKVKVRSGKKGS